jgi:hypothetical protein
MPYPVVDSETKRGQAKELSPQPAMSAASHFLPLSRVLNHTLTKDYRRWYPNFTHTTGHQKLAA